MKQEYEKTYINNLHKISISLDKTLNNKTINFDNKIEKNVLQELITKSFLNEEKERKLYKEQEIKNFLSEFKDIEKFQDKIKNIFLEEIKYNKELKNNIIDFILNELDKKNKNIKNNKELFMNLVGNWNCNKLCWSFRLDT